MRSRTEPGLHAEALGPSGDGPLSGGTANYGRVVRVGDAVCRPTGAHTPAVHALLRHLTDAGFDAAPRVLGRRSGVELLSYIEGEAGVSPTPAWALDDDAIAGVGALLRGLHDHAAGFDGSALSWQRAVPVRWQGPLVTHNDLNPANVIFRDGAPVAMIDFDLAAPACAAFDLAVTACFWVPLLDAIDVDDSRRGRAVTRLGALLDGYDADTSLRRQVVEASPDANHWIADVIGDNARRGHPAFGRLWQRAMGVHVRASTWLDRHSDELLVVSR